MIRLLGIILACLWASGAGACVQLTTANGGIGSSPPMAGGGATRPSISTWGPPTNPGQQGSSGTLGFNDDAVAVWTTIPYQSCSGTICTFSIDADAIAGISASNIKFAANGGTYISATAYPDASPIGATGAACAFVNVADVPAGYLEVRAEIAPNAGWTRELSSVQSGSVPSGSSVVTIPAHGQLPLKVVALTSPSGDTTNFAAYSSTSAGTTQTYNNLYCIVGTVLPNSFLLAKAASATRSDNGTQPLASITCAPNIHGYINGTTLYVTTADSRGTSLANASPLNFLIGSGGYVCQVTVTTTCPSVTSDTSGVGAIGSYTLSANSGTSGFNWSGAGTINTVVTASAITACITQNPSTCATSGPSTNHNQLIVSATSVVLHVGDSITGAGISTPLVITAGPGGGGVGTYTIGTNFGSQLANESMTTTESTLTVASTSSGTIGTGQTIGSGLTNTSGANLDQPQILSGSGSTWIVGLFNGLTPDNIGPTATAMTSGTPVELWAAQIATASTDTTFTLTYWNAGPHEQFPTVNTQKNHNDGSLFVYVDKSPINDYTVYANSVALLGGTGLTSNSPVNTINAANSVVTPTNSGVAQTIGTTGSCSTFTKTGNTGSGNAFFQIGDPVYMDVGVGSVLSAGLYYVLTATTNVLTLSATPGGSCLNDTTLTSGSAWLYRDLSTTTFNLQCYATFGVQCTQQADYAFSTTSGSGPTRGSYLKIQPDPGDGGSDLAVPQWDTALSTDGGGSMKVENVKYTGAIIYPSMTTHLLRPIPAGVSNPTITIPTSSIGSFALTTNSSLLANDCIPSGYYGTIVTGATNGGGAVINSITTNADGTTSINIIGSNGYSALATTSFCPTGDSMMFMNPWHLHNGSSASGSLWLDQVKMYGNEPGMADADGLGGPFGTGQFYKLFITNSAAHYMQGGMSYASIIENSYGYAIYTKCADTDVIVINSEPCDDMSNTHRARFMPVTGPPSPFWEPAIGSSNTTNTITMSPANMPLGLSWLWAVEYKCGSTTATTSLQSFSYATGILAVSPALNIACATTPVSLVHIIDGSHEDCNQYDLPDMYINTNFYDGYNSTPACFGVQTLLPGSKSMMMDTVFLNSNLLFGVVNPEIGPGYYDLQLQMPTSNLYVHNSELSYMSQVNGSFSTPGPGDVVWDNSPCPATPGFMSALVGGSYPFLSVINNPASGGC